MNYLERLHHWAFEELGDALPFLFPVRTYMLHFFSGSGRHSDGLARYTLSKVTGRTKLQAYLYLVDDYGKRHDIFDRYVYDEGTEDNRVHNIYMQVGNGRSAEEDREMIDKIIKETLESENV